MQQGFGGLLKGLQGAMSNPMFTAGASIYQGAPIGQAMAQAQRSGMIQEERDRQNQMREQWAQMVASGQVPKGMAPMLRFMQPEQGAALVAQHAIGAPERERQAQMDNARLRIMDAQLRQAQRQPGAQFGVIGEDAYGRKQYGFIDRSTGRVQPIQAPGGAGAQPHQAGMPAVPAGVDPREFIKAYSKEQGKARATAKMNLPKALDGARATLRYIEQIKNDPNLANVTGWQAWMPTVRGENRAAEQRIEQLKGRAFLEAFEALKGGGQITEREGAAAAASLQRLQDLRQDDASYRQALEEFETEVRALVSLAYRKAGQEPPPQFANAREDAVQQSQPAAGGQPKRLRYNPATGELE